MEKLAAGKVVKHLHINIVVYIVGVFVIFLYCFGLFCYAQQNHPQRIISLGPSITEQLYLLGVEDKLIGYTLYDRIPTDTQTKKRVATVIDVNLEKVVVLKPDLVMATSLTNPRDIEKLKNLGIEVVVFSQPKNFTQLCEQFLKLGRIVGEEKKAEEIISIVREKVNFIKEKIKNLPKPKVFLQIGAKPLFTVTKDSFINDFIKFAGGINIAKDAKTGLYSREKVLKENPDVIIIVTMGITGEKEKEIWQRYKGLNAVKNKRIYILDSYKICSPTPVSFVETLKEIVRILHSEIK